MRVPAVDRAVCTDCDGCLSVCPEVFRRNEATGLIEVVDLTAYPVERVDEAIRFCPADAIVWEEG